MLISSFGWNLPPLEEFWDEPKELNEAAQLIEVSESLLGGKNSHEGRYVQQQTRTQMAVPEGCEDQAQIPWK